MAYVGSATHQVDKRKTTQSTASGFQGTPSSAIRLPDKPGISGKVQVCHGELQKLSCLHGKGIKLLFPHSKTDQYINCSPGSALYIGRFCSRVRFTHRALPISQVGCISRKPRPFFPIREQNCCFCRSGFQWLTQCKEEVISTLLAGQQ